MKNKLTVKLMFLYVFLILCAFQVSAAAWTENLNDGLVAYYNFDEGSGNAVDDVVGGDNNATLFGNPIITTSKFDYARNWTGNSQYGTIATSPQLEGTGGNTMTITAWVYPTSCSNYPTIIGRTDGVSSHSYIFAMYSSGCLLGLYTPSGSWDYSNTALDLNKWNFVSVVIDNGTLTFYKNGISDGTTTNAGWSIGTSYSNFISFYGANAGWEGTIDELGVWKRSLTAEEVSQLYNNGEGMTYMQAPPDNNYSHWETENYTYGGDEYPMLSPYSSGVLGNIGAIKNLLMIVNSAAETGFYPTLNFYDVDTASLASIFWDGFTLATNQNFSAANIISSGGINGVTITSSGYFIGDGSQLTGISTYNATYHTWAYNQTTATFNLYNASWDNRELISSVNANLNASYVPYTGANQNINLGNYNLTTADISALNITGNNIIGNNFIGISYDSQTNYSVGGIQGITASGANCKVTEIKGGIITAAIC